MTIYTITFADHIKISVWANSWTQATREATARYQKEQGQKAPAITDVESINDAEDILTL